MAAGQVFASHTPGRPRPTKHSLPDEGGELPLSKPNLGARKHREIPTERARTRQEPTVRPCKTTTPTAGRRPPSPVPGLRGPSERGCPTASRAHIPTSPEPEPSIRSEYLNTWFDPRGLSELLFYLELLEDYSRRPTAGGLSVPAVWLAVPQARPRGGHRRWATRQPALGRATNGLVAALAFETASPAKPDHAARLFA